MVALLLADGFEEVEAITAIDFLRRAEISVRTLGVSGTLVTGAHAITVRADGALAAYSAVPEYVILPGGMPGSKNLAESTAVLQLLQAVFQQNGTICAICAAPAVVLAPHGYLNEKRFTCFPPYRDSLSVGRYVDEPVVVDDTLITSQGAGTAAAFSAKIIEAIQGSAAAKQIMSATLQYGYGTIQ